MDSEHDIGIRATQSLSVVLITIMGFVNLLTAEIAADYSRPVARVFSLYNQLEIAQKYQKTNLALKGGDVKGYFMLELMAKNNSCH